MILASSDIFSLNPKPLRLQSINVSIHCFRLCLPVIHYHENSDRLQKVTANSRSKYVIKYPKSKKGGHSLIPVKSAATYGSSPLRWIPPCRSEGAYY